MDKHYIGPVGRSTGVGQFSKKCPTRGSVRVRTRLVGRIGSGVPVSASIQNSTRFVGRLGSGPASWPMGQCSAGRPTGSMDCVCRVDRPSPPCRLILFAGRQGRCSVYPHPCPFSVHPFHSAALSDLVDCHYPDPFYQNLDKNTPGPLLNLHTAPHLTTLSSVSREPPLAICVSAAYRQWNWFHYLWTFHEVTHPRLRLSSFESSSVTQTTSLKILVCNIYRPSSFTFSKPFFYEFNCFISLVATTPWIYHYWQF